MKKDLQNLQGNKRDNKMPDDVVIREVGLRDGLQLIKTQLSTQQKLNWVARQIKAGFREMEVTSFVSPKLLPQFSDATEMITMSNQYENFTPTAIVLNKKGAERAIAVGAKKITFVLSASEKHNQSNVRCSTDESLSMFKQVTKLSYSEDVEIKIAGAIATSFGCSMQGSISENRVLELASAMSETGACEIILADTVGYANPTQVKSLFSRLKNYIGNLPMAAHFHDTRGMGLANVVSALEAGVRRFDATMAGLGGCPFAPGASGNIATEDCVYMLENMGFSTGINFKALLELRTHLSEILPDETLEGKLSFAKPAINSLAS